MEEAASRTARLQALRAAKERRAHANPDSSSAAVEPAAGDSAAAAGPKVIFRNYQPSDKSLQETSKLPRAGVAKAAIPAKVADDDNVLNVIAKKANWDLKRDIQPKLQKLERRTEVRYIYIYIYISFATRVGTASDGFCRMPFAISFASKRRRARRSKSEETSRSSSMSRRRS